MTTKPGRAVSLGRLREISLVTVGSVLLHALVVVLLLRMATDGVASAPRNIEVTVEELPDEQLDEVLDRELEDPLQDELVDDMEQPPEVDVAEPEDLVAPVADQPLAIDASVDSPLTMTVLADYAVSSEQLQRGGGASLFGYKSRVKGDLVGTMYDFKRDRQGRPREDDYFHEIDVMLEKGLPENAFREMFEIPRTLYFTHLHIPPAKAETGPDAFGVGDLMEPRKWVVHYKGHLQNALAGRYRFAGVFDDIVVVLIDGKVVLDRRWNGSWRPEPGEWFELLPLQPRKIDILVGERPGGMVGGTLMIEQEGREYAQKDNRPILPIFSVQPLTTDEMQGLQGAQAHWEYDPRTPVFGVRRESSRQKVAKPQDDVKISVM